MVVFGLRRTLQNKFAFDVCSCRAQIEVRFCKTKTEQLLAAVFTLQMHSKRLKRHKSSSDSSPMCFTKQSYNVSDLDRYSARLWNVPWNRLVISDVVPPQHDAIYISFLTGGRLQVICFVSTVCDMRHLREKHDFACQGANPGSY